MSVSTELIRIELSMGALTLREIADRCGEYSTARLHPLVSQMKRRGEVVKVRNVYTLARNRCRLSEFW